MGRVAIRMVLLWELETKTIVEPEELLLLGSSERWE